MTDVGVVTVDETDLEQVNLKLNENNNGDNNGDNFIVVKLST